HPERWDEVARLLAARNLPSLRRSRLPTPCAGRDPAAPPRETPTTQPAVLLLDSLGELAGLYALAAAAFVGGAPVPARGHNPLEPARSGVPIAVGRAMHTFRDMAERFDQAGAWRRVSDAARLAAAWSGWLADPAAAREVGERARRLVEENRG